jgi:hypothetical protein
VKPVVFILLIVFALASCETKRTDAKYYYALDSVLNEQVQYLTLSHATLSKKASIDGKEESTSFVPKDTTRWKYELDVFAELNDINKPANVGKYRIAQSVKDANSNLLIYTIESTEQLPVVFLKVYYLDNLSNIRRIEGLYREESSLLKSSRELSIEFQNINNKIVLTSYSITGGQKMLLGDSVQFSVNGMVTLP